MIKRARHISMLEMILVIALLSVVGSAAGYFSFSASKKEEFQAATHAVMDRMNLAEELMMLGVDLTVTFEKKEKSLLVHLKTDRELDGTTGRLLSIPSPITGIDHISFEGLDSQDIKLHYGSFGMLMPKGDLILKGRYGEQTLPLSLKQVPEKYSQDLYPHEVLQ